MCTRHFEVYHRVKKPWRKQMNRSVLAGHSVMAWRDCSPCMKNVQWTQWTTCFSTKFPISPEAYSLQRVWELMYLLLGLGAVMALGYGAAMYILATDTLLMSQFCDKVNCWVFQIPHQMLPHEQLWKSCFFVFFSQADSVAKLDFQ